MRHISATAMLLVLGLSVMPPACAPVWSGCGYRLSASSCQEVPQPSAGMRCARHRERAERNTTIPSHESRVARGGPTGPEVVTGGNPCADSFKVQPGQCRLRSFVHLHLASVQASEISIPIFAAAKVSSPSRVKILVSSVGPPETDRGPPRC